MKKLLRELLETPPDAGLSIASQGSQGLHLVNSWNSYVILEDDKLIMPAGRMHKTEKNIQDNPQVLVSISNREVQGKSYKGTGLLIEGLAHFESQGKNLDKLKENYPWARAALVIKIKSMQQTL